MILKRTIDSMKIFSQNKGFTLIELLVVIAIIGILASITLSSLNSARDKGADALVKSNLKTIANEAAIFFDDHGNDYSGMCDDLKIVGTLSGAKAAVSETQTPGGLGDGDCQVDAATGSAWAAWVNLKSASTSAYCSDSTGKSLIIPTQDSTAAPVTACPLV